MKFGQIGDPSQVDISFPADYQGNGKLLISCQTTKQEQEVYVGCPVWADKDFVGTIYPKKAKPSQYLYYYARQFNAIELNATHYTIPSLSTVQKWKAAVPAGFRFCPKFPQLISHRKNFARDTDFLDRFLSVLETFGENLGISFLQLPPFFKPEQIEDLYHFLEELPRDLVLALELRHPAWFSHHTIQDEIFDMLKVFHIVAVMTDTLGRRDVLHQHLTAPLAFIRFNGNNLHPVDYQRIDAWVDRIKDWLSQGIQKVYFFMHQPQKALCADLAAYMIKQLNKTCGLELHLPEKVRDTPEQLF